MNAHKPFKLLCTLSLISLATSCFAHNEEVEREIAAIDEQLQTLEKQIEEQDAVFLHIKERFMVLRDTLLDEREEAAKAYPRRKISREELLSELINEIKLFARAYFTNTGDRQHVCGEEFFGDFEQHALFKFYIVKFYTEHALLQKFITTWESCSNKRETLYHQLV